MSSQGVCSLAQSLVRAGPSTCVELLSLEYNEIDKGGINTLGQSLRPIMGQKLCHGLNVMRTNLKELNLNGNDIGNEGVKFLVMPCRRMISIESPASQ